MDRVSAIKIYYYYYYYYYYTYLCIIDFNRVLHVLCKSLYFLDLTLHGMCLDCRLVSTYHALYHMIYVGTNVPHVYMLIISIYNNG